MAASDTRLSSVHEIVTDSKAEVAKAIFKYKREGNHVPIMIYVRGWSSSPYVHAIDLVETTLVRPTDFVLLSSSSTSITREEHAQWKEIANMVNRRYIPSPKGVEISYAERNMRDRFARAVDEIVAQVPMDERETNADFLTQLEEIIQKREFDRKQEAMARGSVTWTSIEPYMQKAKDIYEKIKLFYARTSMTDTQRSYLQEWAKWIVEYNTAHPNDAQTIRVDLNQDDEFFSIIQMTYDAEVSKALQNALKRR